MCLLEICAVSNLTLMHHPYPHQHWIKLFNLLWVVHIGHGTGQLQRVVESGEDYFIST